MYILEALSETLGQLTAICAILTIFCALPLIFFGIIYYPCKWIKLGYNRFGSFGGTLCWLTPIVCIVFVMILVQSCVDKKKIEEEEYYYKHSMNYILDHADIENLCYNLMNTPIDTARLEYDTQHCGDSILYRSSLVGDYGMIDNFDKISYHGNTPRNNIYSMIIRDQHIVGVGIFLPDSLSVFELAKKNHWNEHECYVADTIYNILVQTHQIYYTKGDMVLIPEHYVRLHSWDKNFIVYPNDKIVADDKVIARSRNFVILNKKYYNHYIIKGNKTKYEKYTH